MLKLTDFNWSPEAEAYVIGSLLKAPLPTISLLERMNATDAWFQKPAHAHIITTAIGMRKTGELLEIDTIVAKLKSLRLWSFVGEQEIQACVNAAKNTHNTLAYIQILKDRNIKRQAQFIIHEHLSEFNSDLPAEETLAKLRFELSTIEKKDLAQSAACIADNIEAKYTKAQQSKSIGIASRWFQLQAILGGYVTGKVSFVASRPAQGKTTHGCNEVLNCITEGIGSGIVSIEMSEEEIREKLAADQLDYDLRQFRHGKAKAWEIQKLGLVIREQSEMNLLIMAGNKTIDKVCISIRDMAASGAKFIVVDYIQRITRGHNESATERERYGMYSSILTALASELDVHIMILCQLKREAEFDLRKQRILPSMDHLKGTGDFEQDAHQVILIGRDLKLSGDDELDDDQPMVIKIAKNRNGGLGKINFVFAKSRQKLMPFDVWANDKAEEGRKVDEF